MFTSRFMKAGALAAMLCFTLTTAYSASSSSSRSSSSSSSSSRSSSSSGMSSGFSKSTSSPSKSSSYSAPAPSRSTPVGSFGSSASKSAEQPKQTGSNWSRAAEQDNRQKQAVSNWDSRNSGYANSKTEPTRNNVYSSSPSAPMNTAGASGQTNRQRQEAMDRERAEMRREMDRLREQQARSTQTAPSSSGSNPALWFMLGSMMSNSSHAKTEAQPRTTAPAMDQQGVVVMPTTNQNTNTSSEETVSAVQNSPRPHVESNPVLIKKHEEQSSGGWTALWVLLGLVAVVGGLWFVVNRRTVEVGDKTVKKIKYQV